VKLELKYTMIHGPYSYHLCFFLIYLKDDSSIPMFLSRVVLDSTIAFSFRTPQMMGFQDSFSGDPKMLKAARLLRFGGFTTSGDFSPGLSGLNPHVTKN